MSLLTLNYQHCDRYFPNYVKHTQVANIALQARQQLISDDSDALTLEILGAIDKMKVNGIPYELWVDTDHPVKDELGNAVLGVCEFDPSASKDAALLLITPVCEIASPELVLSTFAHELGHAVFEAPGWIHEAAQGAGRVSYTHLDVYKSQRLTRVHGMKVYTWTPPAGAGIWYVTGSPDITHLFFLALMSVT